MCHRLPCFVQIDLGTSRRGIMPLGVFSVTILKIGGPGNGRTHDAVCGWPRPAWKRSPLQRTGKVWGLAEPMLWRWVGINPRLGLICRLATSAEHLGTWHLLELQIRGQGGHIAPSRRFGGSPSPSRTPPLGAIEQVETTIQPLHTQLIRGLTDSLRDSACVRDFSL
jgi:hypothetical protein